MACLSPSPSGRRLSELLEEKQEPFFLDLHLLEKGCSSSRLLDGFDTAAAMCWPAAAAGAGNDSAASVLKRLTSKKTKKQQPPSPARSKKKKTTPAATGLLRVILSKILHGKSAAVNRKPAALQSSESFKKVEVAGVGEEKETEYTDSDSETDSDDGKQFSPVSVLDQHHQPFDCSPAAAAAQGSPKDAMAFVCDLLLLEAAYSPALLTHLLSKSDELIKNTTAFATEAADDDGDCYYHPRMTSPKNDDLAADEIAAAAYWEANKAELTRVSLLVAEEVQSSSRLDAGDVRRERDGVGGEIGDAVLEDILLELAVELAGGC